MDSTFNIFNQKEYPTMVLCSPNKKILYSLGLAYDVTNTLRFNAISDLEFSYPQSHDGGDTIDSAYPYLIGKMIVLVEGVGYYIISDVEENLDGSIPVKEITAQSLESELFSRRITGFPPNFTRTLQETLDYVLENSPGWTTGSIPESLRREMREVVKGKTITLKPFPIKRTFETKNTTLYKFIIEDIEKAFGCVFTFDSFTRKINAIPSVMPEIPTNIVLSFDNLIEEMDFEEITDEICTAMYCYGANNIDIRDVNPYGGNVIYDFGYFKKEQWMTSGLISALTGWENLVKKVALTHRRYLASRQRIIGELVVQESELDVLNGELAATNTAMEALKRAEDNWTDAEEAEYNRLVALNAKQVEKIRSLKITIEEKRIAKNNANLIILEIVHALYFTRKLSYISIREDLESIAATIGSIMGSWYDSYGKKFSLNVTGMSYASKVVTLTVENDFKVGDTIIIGGVNQGFTATHIDGTRTCQAGTDATKVVFTVTVQPTGTTPQTKVAGTVIKVSTKEDLDSISAQVLLANNNIKTLLSYITNLVANWIPNRPSSTIRKEIKTMLDGEHTALVNLQSLFTKIIPDATNPMRVLEDALVRLIGYKDVINEAQFSPVVTFPEPRMILDSYPSYLTDAQYNELSIYIFENTYTNKNITTHDNPDAKEKLEKANELYKQSKEVLARTSQPRYEFSGKFVNFTALNGFSSFTNELQLGSIVTVMKNDETYIRLALLEIEISYDNPEDIDLVFSNNFRLNKPAYVWGSIMSQAVELSATAKPVGASQGSLAGWNITADAIQGGLDLNSPTAELNSKGYISFGNSAPTTYGDYEGAWLGFINNAPKFSLYSNGSNYLQWDGSRLLIQAVNFTLDFDGNITATSATLSGFIKAETGYIGGDDGWVITSGKLYGGSGSAFSGLIQGTGATKSFFAGATDSDGTDAVFYVTAEGDLVATSATITGAITATSGSIGGWTIDSTQIRNATSTVVLRSAGELAFGTTPPASISSGTGLFLSSAGMYGMKTNVPQAIFSATTGEITAGAGSVALNSLGVTIIPTVSAISTDGDEETAIKWFYNSTDTLRIVNAISSGSPGGSYSTITTDGVDAYRDAQFEILTRSYSGSNASIAIVAPQTGVSSIGLYSDKVLISGGIEGGLVVNELGADVDFRVEGNAKEYLFYIDGTGNGVYINDSANAFSTTGLTINQAYADNEILSLKSSDIGHNFTNTTETDTYGAIAKVNATLGGVSLIGYTESIVGLTIESFIETRSTVTTVGATGAIMLSASWGGGLAPSSPQALVDGNLVVIRDYTTSKFIFQADGVLRYCVTGDADQDLIKVTVTGTPTISWDESEDKFSFSKGIIANITGNVTGDVSGTVIINTGLADHTYSGIIAQMTNGSAVTTARGDVVYLNLSTRCLIADADALSTSLVVGMCADASIGTSATGNYLLHGFYRDDSWTWTAGAVLYLSTAGTTGNTITETAPSGSSDAVVVIGMAYDSNIIYFNPQLVRVVVA